MTPTVPQRMQDAFGAEGIDPSLLLFAIQTDMTPEGDYADVYAALDDKNLYLLFGQEEVGKARGAKRIGAIYKTDYLETHPLAELEGLKSERLLSTARLTIEKDGVPQLLLLCSVGYLASLERLLKAVNVLREGKPLDKELVVGEEELFCPKCGTRYPEPERKICPKCLDKSSIAFRLLSFFREYLPKVALIFTVMIAGTAVSLISPYVGSKMLFDEVLTQGGQYFGMVGIFVLLIFAIRALNVGLNVVYSYALAHIMPWLIYGIKVKIFGAMQQLSVGFYTSKRTGQLMNRVNKDANNIYWFFIDGLPYVILNVLTFTGVTILMFMLSVKLAMVTVFVVPVSVLFFRFLWSVFRRFHHKNWVYSSQLNSMVSDSVNGQRVIKASARESEEASRFAVTGTKQSNIETAQFNIGYTAFPLIYLFMFAGQVAVTAIGGWMVVQGTLSLGTLLTFIAYLTMLYGPLEFMSWVSNWWARCVDSAQRVFEIIDAKPDVEEPENPTILEDFQGAVEIKNVRFEYEPATPILKGVTLSVPAGQMLGIVGKTGAGKSTLANLIARLYDTTEGEILIDGVNVRNLSLTQLRKNIGIVSQEIYLFIGSIADNIRYAKPNADIEEVIAAAKAASAHDFIMKLPDGYETRVGAGGQDLSGGEKQRLSIARTIIQNPKILILDEATAAMDTETEMKIQESLANLKGGRTTIAIAHRLSTLRDADNLAVISEGIVVESGTHDALMIKKGEYHKLYTIQMEGLKTIQMEA